MNNLFEAITTKDTFTENAMPTHSTSGNGLLDMFFKMGGSRNLSDRELERIFQIALSENEELAVRAMFYNRDVRGGQGERRSFRVFLRYLMNNYSIIASEILYLVPEYGRWDDLLVGINTPVEEYVINTIGNALALGDKLCAKWMPREGKANDKIAKVIMKGLHLTPRDYRLLLAGNTDVVETSMSKGNWAEINYSHVPSVAMKNYRKAFRNHDEVGFSKYMDKVESGEVKINASAIFPHDLVRQYIRGNNKDRVLESQWKSLPNYIEEGKTFLPVVDTSGSMFGLPMEVAVSLGIYLSERNKSVFKDGFITFSTNPELQYLRGKTLHSKVNELSTANWGFNTNLNAVFSLILRKAVSGGLKQADLPSYIIILSDMQFDRAARGSDTALEMIRREYSSAGYEVPKLIFWNLRTSSGVPVKVTDTGVALVSGFSPSIMKQILSGEVSPIRIMMGVLDSDRYADIKI